jgi:SAM-dependent methyltransferase
VTIRRFFFDRAYRRGRTPWDTGVTPPEVVEVVEGSGAMQPGRALDLGCGTGTNVWYLAQHGFDVVGVDFSTLAIRAARVKLAEVPRTTVVEGDVTELASLGIEGPSNSSWTSGASTASPGSGDRPTRAAWAP